MELQERYADNRLDDTLFVLCNCGDCDHSAIIFMDSMGLDSEWLSDYPPEYYISVHLSNSGGFFSRLWQAIKYVFGYRSRYGDFGCINQTPKDADKLIEFLQRYKAVCQQWEERNEHDKGGNK